MNIIRLASRRAMELHMVDNVTLHPGHYDTGANIECITNVDCLS